MLLGNRTMYFLIINLGIIGIILAIVGLIFDKKKVLALISIVLLVIPHIPLWMLDVIGKQ
jgi:hypothetical protein